jgi:hypothetical protein
MSGNTGKSAGFDVPDGECNSLPLVIFNPHSSGTCRQHRTKFVILLARAVWGKVSTLSLRALRDLLETHRFSVAAGDLIFLESRWYVTHTGLLGLARRNRCHGIDVRPIPAFCSPELSRWAFRCSEWDCAIRTDQDYPLAILNREQCVSFAPRYSSIIKSAFMVLQPDFCVLSAGCREYGCLRQFCWRHCCRAVAGVLLQRCGFERGRTWLTFR